MARARDEDTSVADLAFEPNITIDLTDGESIDLTVDRNHDGSRVTPVLSQATSVGIAANTAQTAAVGVPWHLDAPDQWQQARVERLVEQHRLLRITLNRPPSALVRRRSSAVIHRSLDIAFGSVFLLIMAPVMILAAAAVKLNSPGPAVYWQKRIGRGGRTFCVWKFRSMVVNADRQIEAARQAVLACNAKTVDAPTFKSAEDPRVTAVGRFLRRSGIDELPQLFNVLVGQMSIVGPRPLVASEVEILPQEAADLRHTVRPGLTCLWQVLRDEDTSFSERMQLDLLYTRRRSVSLDLAIVAITPFALVQGRGAC